PTGTRSSSSPGPGSRSGVFPLRPGDRIRADLARQLEEDVLGDPVQTVDPGDAALAKPADDPADERLRGGCAGGQPHALLALEPRLLDPALVVDQVRLDAARPRDLDEPVRIRAVARADDEQKVDCGEDPLDRPLAVGRRVADVLLRRCLQGREAAPEDADDL